MKTVIYSDIFDYPMTLDEVAHYLVGTACGRDQVEAILSAPVWLDGQIAQVDGYITLQGRESLVSIRRARAAASRSLWEAARRYARVLGLMPYVRMVAVTGALAVDNSEERDDVDFLVVTAPGRVWLSRLFQVAVVYAGKFTSVTLCPNYVLSQDALALATPSVYAAHEFVQMVPLYGFDIYRRMCAANPWAGSFLPNAGRPLHEEPEYKPGRILRALKRAAEWFLSGSLGDRLESWEMRRKIRKFNRQNACRTDGVILDRDQVKGHFDDHGARISNRYQEMLEAYELADREYSRSCSHSDRVVANLP